MTIDLERLYREVKAHIDAVDFSLLWEGFAPLKFALYNSQECFFDGKYIPKTDEFLGNTAIVYQGETIAIWNVMEDMDAVVLASKMIHEMFHGFQRLNGEARFPDEMDALYCYQYSDENLSLKQMENDVIAELLERFDVQKFKTLLQIRRLRSERFAYEFHYESCVEQIEGSAQFVELKALEQLSEKLYLDKIVHLKSRISQRENLVPVRIICYDIGALLLLLLKDNAIAFETDFSDVPFAKRLIADAEAYAVPFELRMGGVIGAYYEKAKSVIAGAMAKNDVVESGAYELLGVNVYNAVYLDGHIISRYFVMYGDKDAPFVQYGDFVIETKDKGKMTKLYRI